MDFTIKIYCKLLDALQKQGFAFQTFPEFIEKPAEKVIILRQDVDKLPENSLHFARIQAERGIKGTYYFRAAPESWNVETIREIYELGHEIGYHYEDLGSTAHRFNSMRGDRRTKSGGDDILKELADDAIRNFSENLEKLRKIVPVKSICMHGNPTSRWDSKLLWKYYDYHDFEITGEPYFDIDFEDVLYLTDTGRRWDGEAFSVRDKVSCAGFRAQSENPYKDWKVKPVNFRNDYYINQFRNLNTALRTPGLHSTSGIIKAAEENRLPDKIMITLHPQRWTDKPLPWAKELVWQNLKNAIKYFLIIIRSER